MKFPRHGGNLRKTITHENVKHIVKQDWGTLGNVAVNNYTVRLFLLENNQVFMQAYKKGYVMPGHQTIISRQQFEEDWQDESNTYKLVCDCLNYLDPEFIEQED